MSAKASDTATFASSADFAPPVDNPVVRSGADLVRLVWSLAALLVVVGLALWAGNGVRNLQIDLVSLVNNVPNYVQRVTAGFAQVALLTIPIFVVGVLVLRRDMRAVGLVVVAVAITIPLSLALLALTSDTSSSALEQAASQSAWISDRGFPGTAYLGGLAATGVILGPWLSRGWRRTIWALVTVVVLLRFLAGASPVFELAAVTTIGIAVGSAVLLAFGAPDRGPKRAEILATLARAGIDLTDLREIGAIHDDSRSYLGATPSGNERVVTVFSDDNRRWDLMFRLYRYLRVRSIADQEVFRSTRSMAEHRAFLAMWARNAGVSVPEPYSVVPVGSGAIAVVEDAVIGASLRSITPEAVTDDALDALWQQVGALEAAHIAHRDLSARSVRLALDDPPRAWVVDFTWGQLAADDTLLGLDLAQLMCEVALIVGIDRTVQSAARTLSPERLKGVLPYLQMAALGDDARRRVRKQKHIPKDLRAAITEATGAEPVKLEKISRVTWKQVGIIALIVAGIYLLLPMVASVPEVWDALQEANWWWIAATLPLVAVQYVGSSANFMGAVPGRLPFWITYLVQLASAFLNRVTPKNVGGMALRLRWLTKRGIDPATSAGSVGLTSLAGTVSTTVLMVVFFVWAGRDESFTFKLPSATTVLIVVAVVAAVLGAFAFTRIGRQLLLVKGWGYVRQALTNLGPLFTSPSKVVMLFGGNALNTLAQIVALDWTLEAFGAGLPFSQVGMVYLFSNLVANASPTPGGIGVIEAALIFMLVGYGVPEAAATSAVLVFRAITYWLVTAPGWVSLEYLRHRDEV